MARKRSTGTAHTQTTGLSCTCTAPSGTVWRSTTSEHSRLPVPQTYLYFSFSLQQTTLRWTPSCRNDTSQCPPEGLRNPYSLCSWELVAESLQLLVYLMLVKLSESSWCGFRHRKTPVKQKDECPAEVDIKDGTSAGSRCCGPAWTHTTQNGSVWSLPTHLQNNRSINCLCRSDVGQPRMTRVHSLLCFVYLFIFSVMVNVKEMGTVLPIMNECLLCICAFVFVFHFPFLNNFLFFPHVKCTHAVPSA